MIIGGDATIAKSGIAQTTVCNEQGGKTQGVSVTGVPKDLKTMVYARSLSTGKRMTQNEIITRGVKIVSPPSARSFDITLGEN